MMIRLRCLRREEEDFNFRLLILNSDSGLWMWGAIVADSSFQFLVPFFCMCILSSVSVVFS